MKTAATIITIATAVAVFAFLAIVGEGRQEAVECNTWKAQAAEFDQFYLLKWQKEQCDAHGIIINAEVK